MDQPSSAPSSQTPATPPAGNSHSTALLVVVSVLIGLLIGIFGFFAWQKANTSPMQGVPGPIVPSNPTPNSTTTPTTVPTTTASNIDPTQALVSVQWKTGAIVSPTTAFGAIIPSNQLRIPNSVPDVSGMSDTLGEYKFSYDFYEQGRVMDGPYKDHVVYGAKQTDREVDMGMDQSQSPEFFNLLVSPTTHEVRLVGVSTSTFFASAWPQALFAPNLRLNLSSFPTTLTLDNGKMLRRADISSQAIPSPLCGGPSGCVDRLPIGRTNDGRNLYEGPTGSLFTDKKVRPGCVILYRENGEGVAYESAIASAIRDPQSSDDPQYPAARIVTPAQLRWDPAFTNTSTFRAHEIGGCGGIDCLRVLRADELKAQDLVQAGTTDVGDPIFVFKAEVARQHTEILNEIYESWYDYDSQTNQKPSYEVFLQRARVPVFFWKDGLGRWVAYKNSIVVPLAECGKPVIYLYPTNTQNVSVKLPSFIQVTVSEPTYPTEGWNVTAEPSGKLTLKDGSNVSSLYWEGLGVNYSAPTTGFVVKNGQVESFLKQTLPRYGLNAQETKDFMDFWVPRMTGAPYYRVSFLTSDWSKQVPLTVNPAPKTNIRLFMDWQRLAGPMQLSEPTITTPTRNGFTLVEWGGLLR